MLNEPQTPSLPAAVAAEQTYLQIPSRPEWIAPTVEYLRDKAILCGACHEARAHQLTLALHEALTNAVVHGNLELSSALKERSDNAFAEALARRAANPRYAERPVEVGVDYDGARCRWTITDQGKGFDVERALARAEPSGPDELRASGRGLLLMRSFVDDVRFELGGRRTVLTLARPSGQEKRRAPRRPLRRPVRVAPLAADGRADWDAACDAVAQNLSADGIAVLQARLAGSDRVMLGIDWEGKTLYVPAEVRHCRARGPGVVELGCQFRFPAAAPAGGAEVERAVGEMLDRLTDSAVRDDERRAYPRAAYTARITVETGPGEEPLSAFGRDLSRGGIAFLTGTPLPPGDVTLTLPQRDGRSLRVVARVVRCNPLVDGVYDVGAQFVALAQG